MSLIDLSPKEISSVPHSRKDWEGPVNDETNEQYHQRFEISSSDLKWILKSPLHFKRMVLEKIQVKREENTAFDMGSCAHECYLLQDTSNFAAADRTFDKRTTEGKTAYAAFQAANVGKRIIDQEQWQTLQKMFNRLCDSPLASRFVSDRNSMIEKGFLYKDPETGLACKFRPDILNLKEGFLVDYKTAESIVPFQFKQAITRYHYHVSMVHYLMGIKRLYGDQIEKVYFVAQEKKEPYAVGIYQMNVGDLNRAYEMRSKMMRNVAICMEKNHWPDWSETIHVLSLPGYAFEINDGEN